MRSPGFRFLNASVGTDGREPLVFEVGGRYETDTAGGWEGGGWMGVTVKPVPSVSVQVGPGFSREFDVAQYVSTVSDITATPTFGARYVFGELEQTELSMATRLNWIFTPHVSFQMYLQPLISIGSYSFLKEAAAPRTYDFLRYGLEAGSIGYDAEP